MRATISENGLGVHLEGRCIRPKIVLSRLRGVLLEREIRRADGELVVGPLLGGRISKQT